MKGREDETRTAGSIGLKFSITRDCASVCNSCVGQFRCVSICSIGTIHRGPSHYS